GWQATGGDPEDVRAVRAAAAFELLQASALVHDDLMDASDIRRGRPAAHRAFERRHEAAGWSGDRARYGAGAAVLLGDLLLAWAHQLLRDSGFEPATVDHAAPLFDLCITEVTAGQCLDLVSQVAGVGDEELALRVVRFKSASYTVVRPLHVGAALGGADPALLAALAAYGEPVGVAFQLRDDVLGVFGDPIVTGKPSGDDIREGKRTLLMARAFDKSNPGQRGVLDASFGNPRLSADGIAAVQQILRDTGALAAVETVIAELTSAALLALRHAPIPEVEAVTALETLSEMVTKRSL
ncbi:MAG: polyprenyl synthetase family protein, partial [Nocardioidaceae bacterium]